MSSYWLEQLQNKQMERHSSWLTYNSEFSLESMSFVFSAHENKPKHQNYTQTLKEAIAVWLPTWEEHSVHNIYRHAGINTSPIHICTCVRSKHIFSFHPSLSFAKGNQAESQAMPTIGKASVAHLCLQGP